MFCWKLHLHQAVGLVLNNDDSKYIKRIVIRILRRYAARTTNLIDDELVNEVERRLLL